MANRTVDRLTEALLAPVDLTIGVAGATVDGLLLVVVIVGLIAGVGVAPVALGTVLLLASVALVATLPGAIGYMLFEAYWRSRRAKKGRTP